MDNPFPACLPAGLLFYWGEQHRLCGVWQYVEGMKLITYALMDAVNGEVEDCVMLHYISSASDLVMELVRKAQKVRRAD
jgi:hypothetical protein